MEKSNDRIPRAEFALANRIARTEACNAAFRALDPAKKRVAIARDVLKWLAIGKLTPGMAYVDIDNWFDPDYEFSRDIVNGGTCQACAVGALFLCAVERGDAGGTIRSGGNRLHGGDAPQLHKQLKSIFEPEQLALIEAAFETKYRFPNVTLQSILGEEAHRECQAAEDFFGKAWDFCESVEREERLPLIMQNIIANKGTFIP